ncbi:MAG: hypothetical protein M3Y25_03330 [Thermoproteota archaeon]|nr:hypothetical protein [Thermoproteota archaeon]
MKTFTLNLYLFFVLSAMVFGNLLIPHTTLANNNFSDSKSIYSVADSNDNHQIQYVDTFDWSMPSLSPSTTSSSSSSSTTEISDVLTASFTNIINTQIYTGLDHQSN